MILKKKVVPTGVEGPYNMDMLKDTYTFEQYINKKGCIELVKMVKKLQDAPLGSVIPYLGTTDPTDGKWLVCDGRDTTGTAIELETHYPSLFMFLGGTNVLPDLREVTLVGAGENTTDTIADHDVYTVGQFKDDQIQNITGQIKSNGYAIGGSSSTVNEGALFGGDFNKKTSSGESGSAIYMASLSFDASRVARTGTTTHGKQKGVNYIIKATSSSDTAPIPGTDIQTIENYVDTGLTTVTNAFNTKIAQTVNYSTTEQWTGGYWIDGKKIYRKCKTQQTYSGSGTNNIFDLGLNGVIDSLVSLRTITKQSNGEQMGDYCFSSTTMQNCYLKTNGTVQYRAGSSYSYGQTTVIIEYTKTTD